MQYLRESGRQSFGRSSDPCQPVGLAPRRLPAATRPHPRIPPANDPNRLSPDRRDSPRPPMVRLILLLPVRNRADRRPRRQRSTYAGVHPPKPEDPRADSGSGPQIGGTPGLHPTPDTDQASAPTARANRPPGAASGTWAFRSSCSPHSGDTKSTSCVARQSTRVQRDPPGPRRPGQVLSGVCRPHGRIPAYTSPISHQQLQ